MINQQFSSRKKGDTFNGAKITITNDDGTAKDLTDYRIKMIFKTSPNSSPMFGFDTIDNTITLPNPTNGICFLARKQLKFPANKYFTDLELTSPDGVVSSSNNCSMLLTPDFS